jgi:hypothetical protein
MVAATPGVEPVVLGTGLSLHPKQALSGYTEVTAVPLFGYREPSLALLKRTYPGGLAIDF